MKVSLISAMGNNRVIGVSNSLPWHMPNDLVHFKRLTLNKPIIMGRKTFESVGQPLPKRVNIVISRDPNYQVDGCICVDSLDKALAACGDVEEAMIVGGEMIYRLALDDNIANCMYLTFIDGDFSGDAFFPEWDDTKWHETQREDCLADEQHQYNYHFVTYERV